MAFGEWLAEARGGMTQRELAGRAGVSDGYITSIERNKKIPSIQNIIALAVAVGRNPIEGLAALAGKEYLDLARRLLALAVKKKMADVDGMLIQGREEVELVEFFRTLNAQEREFLKQAMGMLKGGRGGYMKLKSVS